MSGVWGHVTHIKTSPMQMAGLELFLKSYPEPTTFEQKRIYILIMLFPLRQRGKYSIIGRTVPWRGNQGAFGCYCNRSFCGKLNFDMLWFHKIRTTIDRFNEKKNNNRFELESLLRTIALPSCATSLFFEWCNRHTFFLPLNAEPKFQKLLSYLHPASTGRIYFLKSTFNHVSSQTIQR